MNSHPLVLESALVLGVIVNLATLAMPAQAVPVTVQTEATASNAAAGESGATIAASALIDVVVTGADGKPVSNLGANVGTGTSTITLPSGWTLRTPTVPPGGCGLSPTQFVNQGNGLYAIRVVPPVSNPSCRWLIGDYLYNVQVSTPVQDGSVLGKLTIR